MTLKDILLLGDPRLYEICEPVSREELPGLQPVVDDLADLVLQFRAKYGAGRAIAAPQIGVMKRLVVMNVDKPITIYNPELFDCSEAMMELWDDCMSFPDLHIWLRRHAQCKMRFMNAEWQEEIWHLEGGLSELMQHEIDHLDGILATQRAVDIRSFRWVSRNINP